MLNLEALRVRCLAFERYKRITGCARKRVIRLLELKTNRIQSGINIYYSIHNLMIY